MDYFFARTVHMPFDRAVSETITALGKQGFGVLSDIDVQATLGKKLGVSFRPYRILGACNPSMAYRALQAENKIGTMLPCNVVVQEIAPGTVEIAAIDPVASMLAVENPALAETAKTVRGMLRTVVDSIQDTSSPRL
jgi:uncharacterized protein (DUF302 family)